MGYEASIVNEIYDFTAAVRDSRAVLPSFYDGWKALQIADAMVESSESKQWVRIPRP
jgi:predicted dehydrogenase